MKKWIGSLLLCLVMLPVWVLPAAALADGEYCVSVEMTGGSGKATVNNPTLMIVENGQEYALLTWSSASYDYMIVDGVRYDNRSEEGMNSTFLVPITVWDYPMDVIADTTAMGHPVEIHYQLYFYEESVGDKSQLPQEAAKRVLWTAAVIIVGGGFLNAWIKKKYRI